MPGLVRKLLVFAAVDGLILQPAPPRNHPPATQQAIKIDYKGNVGPLLKDRRDANTAPVSLETHGIVGLLKVATSYFLISICGREQVAQIRGKPVYRITDVALIPLSSQADADHAIVSAREHVQRHSMQEKDGEEDTDSESDEDAPSVTDSLEEGPTPPSHRSKDMLTPQSSPADKKTSVAEDVMHKKGVYGRFADKWFSKKGWSADSRRLQGMSSDDDLARKGAPKNVDSTVPMEEENNTEALSKPETIDVPKQGESIGPEDIPKALEGQTDATTVTLLPKILRTTKMYFSSGNFFFSYDYDLSRGIGQQQPNSSLPLFRQYDPLYFWNENIMSAFIEAGQHNFVLPIIQGFVGQRPFSIKVNESQPNSIMIDPDSTPNDIQLQAWAQSNQDDGNTGSDDRTNVPSPEPSNGKDFLITLISRRSTKRAGLRYLRRGIDDEGNTANSVETEQILSSATWDSATDKIFSFTQYRGSIPLFFSQSPYSLKPQVNTWGSDETNLKAFRRHFADISARYGSIYCASLVDKKGTEAVIGEAYERQAKALNSDGGVDGKGTNLGFEWFDFHNVCRGMRFENVSRLFDTIGPFLRSTSWTEITNDQVTKRQSGVLRTNCMDCLDRTNVVQSACARGALEAQLSAGSFNIDLQNDPSTSWFNNLWADNGDAISRQYAGTAALKGDFTRTRQRRITGALTDFGLTLTRYFNNIVNDYFAQALIDYLLGRATDSIFAEFEADMKSSDYFIDVRKVRQAAIERCAGIVIEDKEEDLTSGWTLSVPTTANTLKTATFEEAVLLLTNKALYFCRLDFGTEKIREFERISLEQLEGVFRGVYITSTLGQRHMDADKNVGFVIRYKANRTSGVVRRNTRSLDSGNWNDPLQEAAAPKAKPEDTRRFLAFKALPPRSTLPTASTSSTFDDPDNEAELIRAVTDEVVRVANKARMEHAVRWNILFVKQRSDEVSPQEGGTNTITELIVEDKDVISAADAKKSTGYLEQLGYAAKKLVWG